MGMSVYQAIGVSIDWPRAPKEDDQDGLPDPVAMLHPDIQGGDFREIKDGANIFLTFSGESIKFDRKQYNIPAEVTSVYALFVNEAAYYEKGIAIMLTKKVDRSFKKMSTM